MNAFALGRVALRIILGGALLAAGASKLFDPATFAVAIATFEILPPALIPLTALGLPFLEIAVGGMLLAGWRTRCAAFSATTLFLVYTAALASGLVRHLPLECDCYGTSTSAPVALLRDVLLLAAAVVLYGWEINRARQAPSS